MAAAAAALLVAVTLGWWIHGNGKQGNNATIACGIDRTIANEIAVSDKAYNPAGCGEARPAQDRGRAGGE